MGDSKDFPKMSKHSLVLLISLIGLGAGEYYHLNKLMWISLIITVIASIATIAVLVAYTIHYWNKYVLNKLNDNKQK